MGELSTGFVVGAPMWYTLSLVVAVVMGLVTRSAATAAASTLAVLVGGVARGEASPIVPIAADVTPAAVVPFWAGSR